MDSQLIIIIVVIAIVIALFTILMNNNSKPTSGGDFIRFSHVGYLNENNLVDTGNGHPITVEQFLDRISHTDYSFIGGPVCNYAHNVVLFDYLAPTRYSYCISPSDYSLTANGSYVEINLRDSCRVRGGGITIVSITDNNGTVLNIRRPFIICRNLGIYRSGFGDRIDQQSDYIILY